METKKKRTKKNVGKIKIVKKKIKNNIKTFTNNEKVRNVKNKVVEGFEDAKELVQNKYTQIKNKYDEGARIREKNRLAPIFLNDIKENLYSIPDVIRIVESDKEHMKSELCKGAIGWDENRKEIPHFCLYLKDVKKTGIQFYPDVDETIFYKAPYEDNKYISINKYFEYNVERQVAEFRDIACDLGAKRVTISTYEEIQSLIKTASQIKAEAKKGKKAGGGASVDLSSSNSEYKFIKVELDRKLPGSADIVEEPKLIYFQGNDYIEDLISRRKKKGIESDHYSISYQVKNGMKEKTAVKLDALIKGLKINGNTSITNEVQKDNRSMFDLYIEFPKSKQ